jgi:hypothetical protein
MLRTADAVPSRPHAQREGPAMATGDDQVLPDYFPVLTRADTDLAAGVVTSLAAARSEFVRSVPGGFLTPAEAAAAARASAIVSARADLRGFLDSLTRRLPGLGSRSPAEVLQRFYQLVRGRSFAQALDDLALLDELDMPVRALTADRIRDALTGSDVTFAVLGPIVDPNEPEHLRRKTINKLAGYRGTRFTSDQIARLLVLRDFLAGGPERDFRIRLWRAECHVGMARADAAGDAVPVAEHYRLALLDYQRLLPPGTSRTLTPRQRFVAVRAASTQVGRGDTLFRRSFRFTGPEKSEIAEAYCAAIGLLRRPGVTGPDAEHLREYATQQLTKLGTGQNFLGYRDTYVPDVGPAALGVRARNRIAVAIRSSERYEHFKARADQLVEELEAMAQDELEREIGLQIATETQGKAAESVGGAETAIENLRGKADDLQLGLAAGLSQAVFATVTLGAGGGVTGQASGPGVVSSLVQYLGATEDLANQLQAAQTALRLAQRDKAIADLEASLAASRLDFVTAAIDAKKNGAFNADRFFAVANAYEDMTRRHLDRACELLYLYERAISFRRLKSLSIVEAAAARGDVLLAPDQLEEVLTALDEEAAFDGRGQDNFPLPPWSLPARYPLEFARFLQTGSMEFVISVYELEKLLHGRHNVRVRRIGVEVDGLLSPAGFVGTLTHRGVTLVRDRDATLQPPATRLNPTEAELRTALGRLEGGTADRVAVQGLVPFVLGESPLSISSEQEPPPIGDQAFDLLPIEGYGLTGAWRLDVPDTDLRNVTDVRLMFVVSVPQASEALDDHVIGLIDAYEQELADGRALDAILAISLRQRFPDAFDALATGEAAFALGVEDFPAADELRIKAVVAQAVDADGAGLAGVGLEIAHDPAPTLVRTTGPGGFTEDLGADLPELPEADRAAPTGTWRLRLADPSRFADIGDLTLFVVYTFRPAPG